jgi:hypothetical protein
VRDLTSAQSTPLAATATRPVLLIELGIGGQQKLTTGGDYTVPVMSATGGTITTVVDGGIEYKVHTFTSSGTFTVSGGMGTVDYLVVAGGGGGGTRHGGAGGAGGYRTGTTTAAVGAHTVTVGAGGTGGAVNTSRGGTGGNSSALDITALGGGGGGSFGFNSNGADGGSGGGACTDNGTPGSGTSGQGNDGGKIDTGTYPGTGGGGAGAAGSPNVSGVGGAGGNGLSSSISGTATTYAGGGGGAGETTAGTGGSGGGGNGAIGNDAPQAGTANTGGGGGGARNSDAISLNGGAGGTGVVILRYPVAQGGSYVSSDVRVTALNNWMSAQLEFDATTQQVGWVIGGDWVRASATISLLPADGVAPVLLLSGIVTAAAAGPDKVRYTVTHRGAAGRWTPRIRMTSAWLNHLPAPGTRFLWQGDTYILESR